MQVPTWGSLVLLGTQFHLPGASARVTMCSAPCGPVTQGSVLPAWPMSYSGSGPRGWGVGATAAQASGSGCPVATPAGGGLLCGVDLGNLPSRAWLLTPPHPHTWPPVSTPDATITYHPAGQPQPRLDWACWPVGQVQGRPHCRGPLPAPIHTVPGWVLLLRPGSPLLPASSGGPPGLLGNWGLCPLFASVSPVNCGGGLGVPWTLVLAHMEYLLCPWGAGDSRGLAWSTGCGPEGMGTRWGVRESGRVLSVTTNWGEGRGPHGALDPVTSQPRQLL